MKHLWSHRESAQGMAELRDRHGLPHGEWALDTPIVQGQPSSTVVGPDGELYTVEAVGALPVCTTVARDLAMLLVDMLNLADTVPERVRPISADEPVFLLPARSRFAPSVLFELADMKDLVGGEATCDEFLRGCAKVRLVEGQ